MVISGLKCKNRPGKLKIIECGIIKTMKSQVLNTIVWKEDKIFVAKFLEVELASQGKTKEEAIKNLKEALDLYLEDEPKNVLFPQIDKVSFQKIQIN